MNSQLTFSKETIHRLAADPRALGAGANGQPQPKLDPDDPTDIISLTTSLTTYL